MSSHVLFVGHGNPMYAIESNAFTAEWAAIGRRIGKPDAVVSISAHWETIGSRVTTNERQRTIHDFYGFPQPLFDVRYDAPGAPDLAAEIIARTGIERDDSWGLDHGTWSVLRHVFPDADVPVIQISLDRRKSPAGHFMLARELRFLREKRILVIASGNIVHNLGRIRFDRSDGEDWAVAANEMIRELVIADDATSLIAFETLGADVRLAIPTPEHFLPLLYVLGLRDPGDSVRVFNDVVELGSLSMTSFELIP